MATISLADPINGTIIDATLVQANNSALETTINGGLDNNNLSANPNIDPAKLAGFPADATKVLKGDATWGAPPGSGAVSAYHFPPVTVGPGPGYVANTLVPVITQVIPANALGTNKCLKVRLQGDFLVSTGVTVRLQIIFGGVTFFDDISASIPTSGSRRPWFVDFTLGNTDATHQNLAGNLRVAGAIAATTGIGDLATAIDNILATFGSSGLLNVDTTVAQTLVVNLALSLSNATVDMRCHYLLAEVSG